MLVHSNLRTLIGSRRYMMLQFELRRSADVWHTSAAWDPMSGLLDCVGSRCSTLASVMMIFVSA